MDKDNERFTEENTWELASLFTEFPEPLGRVSFIQMYCKAHGKNIDLNSCWAVDDYLDKQASLQEVLEMVEELQEYVKGRVNKDKLLDKLQVIENIILKGL